MGYLVHLLVVFGAMEILTNTRGAFEEGVSGLVQLMVVNGVGGGPIEKAARLTL